MAEVSQTQMDHSDNTASNSQHHTANGSPGIVNENQSEQRGAIHKQNSLTTNGQTCKGGSPPRRDMYWFAHGGDSGPESKSAQDYHLENLDPDGVHSGGLSLKEREDRARIFRERQLEERSKKIEELKYAAVQAQKYRILQEEERRRRIEEMRHRDIERRSIVEERKKIIFEAEKERRDVMMRKSQEREARVEAMRNAHRSSIGFAFGSSTPRLLELEPHSVFTGRRSSSQSNMALTPTLSAAKGSIDIGESDHNYKRAQSTYELDLRGARAGEDIMTQSVGSISGLQRRFRRKTDLIPTIPVNREGSKSSLMSGSGASPGRAFSMTRLDILSQPRQPRILAAVQETSVNRESMIKTKSMSHLAYQRPNSSNSGTKLGRHTPASRSKSMSKSMTHLVPNRMSPSPSVSPTRSLCSPSSTMSAPRNLSPHSPHKSNLSKSMLHLAVLPPRPTRASQLRKDALAQTHTLNSNTALTRSQKMGMSKSMMHLVKRKEASDVEVNQYASVVHTSASSSSPTRPHSSMSQHSLSSHSSSVNLRTRSAPRRPRPLSVAGTMPDKSTVSDERPSRSAEKKTPPVPARQFRAKSAGPSSEVSSPVFSSKQSVPPKKPSSPPVPTPRKPSAPPQVKEKPKVAPKPTKVPPKPTPEQIANSDKAHIKTSKKSAEIVNNPKPESPIKQNVVKKETVKEKEIIAADIVNKEFEIESESQIDEVLVILENPQQDFTEEQTFDTIFQQNITDETMPSIESLDSTDNLIIIDNDEAIPKDTERVPVPQLQPQPQPVDVEETETIKETAAADVPEKGITNGILDEASMTDSVSAGKQWITTEEQAKAALAERRRLAREQAEREAELERLRQEELQRQEEMRLKREEEERMEWEAEQDRMRKIEEERLQKAIEEQHLKEEEEKQKREEEALQRAEKEEIERKAKIEAEKLKKENEERLRKEEEERAERRKRVEAIMSRTRGKGMGTPVTTPTKGVDPVDVISDAQDDRPINGGNNDELSKSIFDEQSGVAGISEEQPMLVDLVSDATDAEKILNQENIGDSKLERNLKLSEQDAVVPSQLTEVNVHTNGFSHPEEYHISSNVNLIIDSQSPESKSSPLSDDMGEFENMDRKGTAAFYSANTDQLIDIGFSTNTNATNNGVDLVIGAANSAALMTPTCLKTNEVSLIEDSINSNVTSNGLSTSVIEDNYTIRQDATLPDLLS